MQYRIIVTGAHGLVGDGVLRQCLESRVVSEVLLLSRWPKRLQHVKLKELIIPDFLELDVYMQELTGYDACFYCSQMPSASLDERIYSHFAIDMTLSLASNLLLLNPNIIFSFLSESSSDAAGLDNVMTAKINSKTENALAKLIFRKLYFFRVKMISPSIKQKNIRFIDKLVYSFYPLLKILMPNKIITTEEIGSAMINTLVNRHPERVVGVKEIREISKHEVCFANINTLIY